MTYMLSLVQQTKIDQAGILARHLEGQLSSMENASTRARQSRTSPFSAVYFISSGSYFTGERGHTWGWKSPSQPSIQSGTA
eukprot:2792172-Amphidinium_carterae.1